LSAVESTPNCIVTINESSMPAHEMALRIEVLRACLRKINYGLDLSKLIAIHIPENYRDELFAFQDMIGTMRFSTENELISGCAQVVTDRRVAHEYHIFLKKELFLVLVPDDYISRLPEDLREEFKNTRSVAIETLRHELCHVHEMSLSSQIPWLDKPHEKSIRGMMNDKAYAIWREYYACKLCAEIVSVNTIVDEASSLIDTLKKSENLIGSNRRKYNTCGMPLNDFINHTFMCIDAILRQSAFFMGHADKIIERMFETISPAIEKYHFGLIMRDMRDALLALSDAHPSWNDDRVFDNAGNLILKYIHMFRLYPSILDDGSLYISIPVEV
jgi:hypothetical protein